MDCSTKVWDTIFCTFNTCLKQTIICGFGNCGGLGYGNRTSADAKDPLHMRQQSCPYTSSQTFGLPRSGLSRQQLLCISEGNLQSDRDSRGGPGGLPAQLAIPAPEVIASMSLHHHNYLQAMLLALPTPLMFHQRSGGGGLQPGVQWSPLALW